MFKKIKQTITTLVAVMALATPLAVPAVAGAAAAGTTTIQDSLCTGATLDTTDTTCAAQTDSGTEANRLIKNIINIFSIVVGVVAVIMIIVGGFRYITSGGNDSSVSGAKNTILYAVVGLVVVALAQIIVRFVLTKTTQA